ncbi:hypothetical protein [Halomarina rubra]|uniref:DUF2207 domain-containing protein n=1 Tax=Halomarina rubra TaxID=2071873 RepID=A0ABD6ARW1_9EURY|nr:hypothetical protein [Halomarina rubra]
MTTTVAALVMTSLFLFTEGDGDDQVGFSGRFSVENGFEMTGVVTNDKIQSNPPTYRNVTVLLYDEQGRLYQSERVGTVEYRTNVTVTSGTVPKYVVIDSPDLWNDSTIVVDYYEREDSGLFRQRLATSRANLPVTLPSTESN